MAQQIAGPGASAAVARAGASPGAARLEFSIVPLRGLPIVGAVIARLMKRFVYSAGVTGAMQVATLIIMTRLATA